MLQHDKAPTVTRIIDAATELFYEKGYHGTSMREIAATVGIRPASVYNHFASKEDILFEITSGTMQEMLVGARSAITTAGTPEASFAASSSSTFATASSTFATAPITGFGPRSPMTNFTHCHPHADAPSSRSEINTRRCFARSWLKEETSPGGTSTTCPWSRSRSRPCQAPLASGTEKGVDYPPPPSPRSTATSHYEPSPTHSRRRPPRADATRRASLAPDQPTARRARLGHEGRGSRSERHSDSAKSSLRCT